MTRLREALKPFVPPFLVDLMRRHPYGWTGDYASWDEAERASSGYGRVEILSKVRAAALRVKRGDAVAERDSVTFAEPLVPWQVLSVLSVEALRTGGLVSVLDFGGSLGSTYMQTRPWLQAYATLEWSIVEQPHFVAAGREDFEDTSLRFFETAEECFQSRKPSVLLLSGVLQYLADPLSWLRKLAELEIRTVVIDRTAVCSGTRSRITVQRVPPQIYDASYPSWNFHDAALPDALLPHYRTVGRWTCEEQTNRPDLQLRGYVLQRA